MNAKITHDVERGLAEMVGVQGLIVLHVGAHEHEDAVALCAERDHIWRKRHPKESLARATSFVCETCHVCGIRKGARIIVEKGENARVRNGSEA